jgi:uncharacterized membrane protein
MTPERSPRAVEPRRVPRARLAPRRVFVLRMLRSFGVMCLLIALSLGFGAVGYHELAGLSWLDATLNASMILTGMGPVDPLTTPAAKVFGIVYSLFSGVAFLTMVAVLLAPALHRLLHRFHLEQYGSRDS